MTERILVVVLGLFVLPALACGKPAKASTGLDEDEMAKVLEEAQALAKSKEWEASIEKCERVIAAFTKNYAKQKKKIYCAHTPTESLGYLVMAAAADNRGKAGKAEVIVISPTWSDAWYVKGYALMDLGKFKEARKALEQAVALSPLYSQYLNELGMVYEQEKNWAKAMEVFKLAEDQASMSPDDIKDYELGRARRGQAYVHVELGQLDGAEKMYQQCLKTDPADSRAARELDYVHALQKAKKKK